jgi:hypothetical protein
VRLEEHQAGLENIDFYSSFARNVETAKRKLLRLLIEVRDEGSAIAAYGAAAKGNTLLNYCGIGTDLIDYVVDLSPKKQGLFLPGTHIEIRPPGHVRETRPDYLLVLPWNLETEIVNQMAFIREWGGRFIVPIPEPRIRA